jgi:hypothetical protein
MSALPVSFISTWRLVRGRGRGQARIIVEVEAGPARFGSYRKPMGVWGCFRIYRPSSVRRFRPRKM